MSDGITFQIKTLNPAHKCIVVTKNSLVTADWISKTFEQRIRSNPELKNKNLKDEIK